MCARSSGEPDLDLFDRTVAGMEQRLNHARDPRHLLDAVGWGLGQLERTYAATPPRILATVACRDGCDFCCRVPVDVQAHEVLFAADHIQTHFPPQALADAIDRLAAHRERNARLTDEERNVSRSPCALLHQGSCTIYAGRPEACRSHHATDAAVCEAHMKDPSVDLEHAYVGPLRARMFSVMLGIDEALEASGYDERSYDFGSALHEALTDSFCLARWLRGERAFPDSCLADAGRE